MRLIRLGNRVVNLEYLIMYESGDTPGHVRVTLETGIVLDLPPEEGNALRRLTADLIQVDPEPPKGTVGREVRSEGGTGARRRRGSGR